MAACFFVYATVEWIRCSKAARIITFISGPSVQNYALVNQLLKEGRSLVVGGISIQGDEGVIVRMVCFLQSTRMAGSNRRTGFRGWSYFLDKPLSFKEKTFYHFDTNTGEDSVLALPTYMIYIVGEVDEGLLLPEADTHTLKVAADNAASFIHD